MTTEVQDNGVNVCIEVYAIRKYDEPVMFIRAEKLKEYLDRGYHIYDGLQRCFLSYNTINTLESITQDNIK